MNAAGKHLCVIAAPSEDVTTDDDTSDVTGAQTYPGLDCRIRPKRADDDVRMKRVGLYSRRRRESIGGRSASSVVEIEGATLVQSSTLTIDVAQ
jgi:hypothetical protein